jgi:molybdopterin-guanine dinucleotide biosynthesis protein A
MIVGSDSSHGQATGPPAIADRMAGAGALGGLYTAPVEAPTEQVLVMACDMPLPTAPFLSRLAVPGADAEAVVPRDADGLPVRGASHTGLAGRLNARIDAGAIIDAFGDLDVRHVGPG